MKRAFAIMAVLCGCLVPLSAQNDLMILRNGRESNVAIVQVNDREVIYKESIKKNAPELSINNSEIYMLRFAKRGNVYITAEGKRVTGENQTIPRDADIVYLVEGKEIPAYDLRVMEDRVTFLLKKNKNSKVIPIAEVFPRSAVFMIRYSDGTRDVLTDISLAGKQEKVEPALIEEKAETEKHEENELQVVFHRVIKGETLSSIAQKYDVAVTDIISWNDLPAKFKPTAKLQPDMQLMLYVKPIDTNP